MNCSSPLQRPFADVTSRTVAPSLRRRKVAAGRRSIVIGISLFAAACTMGSGECIAAQPEEAFSKSVAPILKSRCVKCHNDANAEADLNLTGLNPDMVAGKDAESWHDVLNKLNLGEMPPEDETQLTPDERKLLVNWLTGELKRATDARRSTGGRTVLRRLTRYEYANTMRDLLGIELDYGSELPPEPASPDGFRNNGSALGMSPLQLEYYLKIARLALQKAIVRGDRPELIQHRTDKTIKMGGRSKNNPVGNRMYPGWRFLTKLQEFPRQGEFVIRAECGMRIPEGSRIPSMTAFIGVQADTISPMKAVDQVLVDAPLGKPAIYEFRGRIEEFPLPGQNPKFPGMLVVVMHDGEAPPVPKKAKKNRKNEAKEEPPAPDDLTRPMVQVNWIEFEGPIYDQWPPSSHTRILFASEYSDKPLEYAREVISRFMTRAYRRPVTDVEVDDMLELFRKVRKRTDSFEEAIQEVLAVVLISPDFLYLIEPSPEDEGEEPRRARQPLTEHELAARLSYFLWSTMPDDELTSLAAAGRLRDPAILQAQVHRLLKDERSWSFVEHFAGQWLNLSGIDRVAVNPEFYPDFDETLKEDMRLETLHFFNEILRHDLSAFNLLDSDFIVINQRMAEHYGIRGPEGAAFERVQLPADSHRGGVTTQAGILLANSSGEDSHPIRRAVWILDRILGDPPPPPPPDVPELNTDEPDFAALPLKKQLELHRDRVACNSCHQGIDPWGVPFENFDAVGRWRTEVVKPGKRKNQTVSTPVDSKSTLPGGHKIDRIETLKKHLIENERDRFSRALVSRLMAYSLGRSVEFSDRETVESLRSKFEDSDFRISDLIVAIVQSEEFQTK